MNDEFGNKVDDLKGRAKEAAGAATDDDSMKAEGKRDQAKASFKDKIGDAKDKIEEKIDDVL